MFNLSSEIQHRNLSLKEADNFNYKKKRNDNVLKNSNYSLTSCNKYIKESRCDLKGLEESINVLNEYKKIHGSSGTNVLESSIKELLYKIQDIGKCSVYLENNTSLDSLIETSDNLFFIDRLQYNYKFLNENKKIDNLYSIYRNFPEEFIIEFCKYVDSFDLSSNIEKLNIALETAEYLNEIYKLNIDAIEEASNYFVYNVNSCSESDFYLVLESNKFLKKKFNNTKNKVSKFTKTKTKEALEGLKKCSEKDRPTINRLLQKIYSDDPENIIEELPNILKWIRVFGVIAVASNLPFVFAVPVVLADAIIGHEVKKKHIKKSINAYENNIEKSKELMKSTKDDKEKEALKKSIEKLEKGLDMLKDYEDSLYSEKYNDEKNGNDLDFGDDDFDFEDFDEATIIMNSLTPEEYMESRHLQLARLSLMTIAQLNRLLNARFRNISGAFTVFSKEDIEIFSSLNSEELYRYINKCTSTVETTIALIISSRLPELDYLDEELFTLLKSLQNNLPEDYRLSFEGTHRDDTFKLKLIDTVKVYPYEDNEEDYYEARDTYCIINAMEECVKSILNSNLQSSVLNKLNEYSTNDLLRIQEFNSIIPLIDTEVLKESYEEIYNKYVSENTIEGFKSTEKVNIALRSLEKNSKISEGIELLDCKTILYELCAINNYIDDIKDNTINESFISGLKIAKEKIARTAKKLSDKDKLISNKLDNMVDKLIDQGQKAMTSKNREAVIKGSILPSLSSMLKLILGSGIVGLIDPFLGGVTMVVGLGLSKYGTAKERQFILDEIDIQLKMVEKKMQLAEQNNDMDAMEELLKTEKKLQRERQRIYYKLRPNRMAPSN